MTYGPKPKPLAERFASHVAYAAGDACWLWDGHVDPKTGYGSFGLGSRTDGSRRTVQAHRVAFFLAHGRWPVPQANHTCDIRRCVRPDHLYEGTQQQNIDDRERRGRGNRPVGAAAGGAKLSEGDVAAIRCVYGAGEATQQQLADRYGVSRSAISDITRGRNWASATVPAVDPVAARVLARARRTATVLRVWRRSARLSEPLVLRLREEFAAGWWRSVRQLALAHGISPQTAHLMLDGRTWKHVPMPWSAEAQP